MDSETTENYILQYIQRKFRIQIRKKKTKYQLLIVNRKSIRTEIIQEIISIIIEIQEYKK